MTAAVAGVDYVEGRINRFFISFTLILCTTMIALDSTLSAIALPHMQGTLAATDDQISLVVTSYFVATAIVTACSGFIAGRVGRKRVYLVSLAGFVITSMMAGSATSLNEMILMRTLQGAFAAPIAPISQATILDTYPTEKHGQALSLWAMGVMVAPIFGPVIGGFLTESISWRWVFYVNVPFGLLGLAGALVFLRDTARNLERQFDWFGFCALALALVMFQVVLDGGERQGWFDSAEIIFACGLGVLFLYIFIVHSATTKNPFVSLGVLRDRNFLLGVSFVFMNGIIVMSPNVIIPLFLQNLRGFPVMTAGIVMGPRALGTLLSMLIAGRLVGKVPLHVMMIFGFLVICTASFRMSYMTADVSMWSFISITLMHGLGFGFVWVPLMTMTYATLPREHRTEAAALWSLIRSYGVSVGVSVVMGVLARSGAQSHAGLTAGVHPYNPNLNGTGGTIPFDIASTQGLAMIEAEISRQSWMIGFLNDFRLLVILGVCMVPLVFLLRPPGHLGNGKRGP